MIYLKKFTLLTDKQEHDIVFGKEIRRIFNSYYPIGLFSSKDLKELTFSNITIFYGGNGSGKTTLINMIAEKLEATTKTRLEKGSFFDIYVEDCKYEMNYEEPIDIKLISSDDVFDYLLDVRSINTNVNRKKEKLSREYLDHKFHGNSNFDNYEELREVYDSKTKSMSKFVRDILGNNNIVEQSNGESALMFWEREIKEDSIYLVDKHEKIEWKLTPSKKVQEKIGSEKTNGRTYQHGWQDVSITRLINQDYLFTGVFPISYELRDGLFAKFMEHSVLIREQKPTKIIAQVSDGVFFLENNILYAYFERYGEVQIMSSFEWNFNYNRIIFIF